MRLFKVGRYVTSYANGYIKYRRFIWENSIIEYTISVHKSLEFKGYLL